MSERGADTLVTFPSGKVIAWRRIARRRSAAHGTALRGDPAHGVERRSNRRFPAIALHAMASHGTRWRRLATRCVAWLGLERQCAAIHHQGVPA